MDLNNLVTVEYSVSYNQSKLQNVIKQLESKITVFDQSVKSFDEKCKQIQQSQSNTSLRLQKFEKFAVDNIRLAVNQVSTLKHGLRNYLGQQWIKQEEKVQIQPKSQNINKLFQSKLSAFNSQAKQLSQRVSELKVQLNNKTSFHEEQTQQVKNTIIEHKKQIHRIRQSIRQDINEKFSHYKKEFQEKNLKEIYKKVQIASEASLRSLEQIQAKSGQAIQNALKKYKRVSITNAIQSTNQIPTGKPATLNDFQSCGKLIMGRMDMGQIQDVTEFDSDIKNKNKTNWSKLNEGQSFEQNELNHLRMSAGLNFLHRLNPPINPTQQKQSQNNNVHRVQTVVETQSMQHAINQLKDQLKALIKADTMQFRTCIQSLTAHNQKMDATITYLVKDNKQFKADSLQVQSKITDIKNQIQNLKNSIYQSNQKQNQSLGRIIQQQSKTQQLQSDLIIVSKEIQSFLGQSEDDSQSTKFKDIQNIRGSQLDYSSSLNNSKSGIKNSLMYKNSVSSPSLKEDGIVMNRLNLLTQKLAKIQEKLKNGGFNSQKNLPKINSSTFIATKNGGNTPSFDLYKKDVIKTNQELNKTNQRLEFLKKNLKQLEAAHNLIPNRLTKLQTQVTQINQIQQDRLLELIKELINRTLTDPFNNHFTNTLKRQIHVKFLEIKHQYSSIWKDIETKVTDRAETAQLQKLKQIFETQNVQMKTLISKKADNDDFKKGIKYIDTKLKEVYSYLKGKQVQENSPQGRKYYMGKKV